MKTALQVGGIETLHCMFLTENLNLLNFKFLKVLVVK